jgi:hypothetical protein
VARGLVSEGRTSHYSSAFLPDCDISNLGYKRDDPATIHEDYLPVISEKGMVFGYGELDRTSFSAQITYSQQVPHTRSGLGQSARNPELSAHSKRSTRRKILLSASTPSTSPSPTAKTSSPTSHGLTKVL